MLKYVSDCDIVKPKTNILELFQDAQQQNKYLKVCAPMVRYSKLQFRNLVQKYNVDLCFTPMIMADSFCQSEKARVNDFTTNLSDSPIIAQFATDNCDEYLSAAEMLYKYVDGIDLNCGCPQNWAMQCGYGCSLLKNPELIKDLTSTIRRNLPTDFSVSCKIRIEHPLSKTISLCQQLEKCNITFVTCHGRTPSQKSKDLANMEAIKLIKESVHIPVIANGDVRSLNDADELFKMLNCNGIMSARGILSNPTLFKGQSQHTTIQCIQDWLNICYEANDSIKFQCMHHHFTFMMDKILTKTERIEFNNYSNKLQVYDFLNTKFNITPQTNSTNELNTKQINCYFDIANYKNRINVKQQLEEENERKYDYELTQGKYFIDIKNANADDNFCDLDFIDPNIFNE